MNRKIDRELKFIFLTILAAIILLALPLAPSLAQDADDDFSNSDPCRGDPDNPVIFQLYPDKGAPGSTFFIIGKPHDPRTVGPGSGVSFNWREDTVNFGFSAEVKTNGYFIGLIKVPPGFSPGNHVLMYAEASPFTSCLEYTVIEGQPGSPAFSTVPGLNSLFRFIALFL